MYLLTIPPRATTTASSRSKDAVHDVGHVFGIELFGQRREARDVSVEDGRLVTFAFAGGSFEAMGRCGGPRGLAASANVPLVPSGVKGSPGTSGGVPTPGEPDGSVIQRGHRVSARGHPLAMRLAHPGNDLVSELSKVLANAHSGVVWSWQAIKATPSGWKVAAWRGVCMDEPEETE
jgi:hypothetical protein